MSEVDDEDNDYSSDVKFFGFKCCVTFEKGAYLYKMF